MKWRLILTLGLLRLAQDLVPAGSIQEAPGAESVIKRIVLAEDGPAREADVNQRITQADALEDVQQFFSTLQRVHPDLLAKVTEVGEYLKLKRQMTDEIAGKTGKDGRIAIRDLAYMLYYAAAFFGDGHTSVRWGLQQTMDGVGQPSPPPPPFLRTLAAGKRLPPFLLRSEDGEFIVEGSDDASINGLEVLAVDGKPILEFLRPILDRCPRETPAGKAALFTADPLFQIFWYSFTELYGSDESIQLRLRDARGSVRERTLRTVDLAEFAKLAQEHFGIGKLLRRGTAVFFYDSGRIAHLVYPSFNLTEDEKRKLDGIFEQIKAQGARELILDLRHNPGGHPQMREFIFSYLHDGKFTLFSKERAKLSRGVTTELAELDGLIATVTVKEQSRPKPKGFFTGRSFLLVDSGTYSSAADFAAVFRDYRVGTIIGSETGGFPICFGQTCSFRLAHSGIGYDVSSKQLFPPNPKPGDDEHGVRPDIPANHASLRGFRNREDPVLALTIDHIKKTRPKRRLH